MILISQSARIKNIKLYLRNIKIHVEESQKN
jgi:hypothetical protein